MSQSSASFDPLTNPNEDASQDVRDEYVDWPNRCEFLSEVELYRELSGLEQRKKSSVRIYNMYLNDDTAPQPLYISEDMHYVRFSHFSFFLKSSGFYFLAFLSTSRLSFLLTLFIAYSTRIRKSFGRSF